MSQTLISEKLMRKKFLKIGKIKKIGKSPVLGKNLLITILKINRQKNSILICNFQFTFAGSRTHPLHDFVKCSSA